MNFSAIGGLFNSLLDTLMPRRCVHCSRTLSPAESVFCTECLSNLETASQPMVQSEFDSSFRGTVIDRFFSPYVFRRDSEIQSLIHSFKYSGNFRNAVYGGILLGSSITASGMASKTDIIIPVPLHKLKRLERGYNQADYICKGIAKELKLPVDAHSIKRIVHTKSQTFLNREERLENMKDAFTDYRPERVEGKRVLLVDDVKTTGTTLIECANAIKKAGAAEIAAATLAIAAPDII